jgi:hypothetical protein
MYDVTLQAKADVRALGDMAPQVDADALPGIIVAFHGERRGDRRADHQFPIRKALGVWRRDLRRRRRMSVYRQQAADCR